jgi:ABC-2 type transport system ATP-binding protein
MTDSLTPGVPLLKESLFSKMYLNKGSVIDMDVIHLENVTKSFGAKTAVNNLSLTVTRGSVLALLGPNGAGKSTTVSMMLGLTTPTSGTVRVLGDDPRQPKVRQRMGAMLQDVSAIDRLKVRETIDLFRSYYDNPLPTSHLLEISGLQQEANMYASKMSGGQKRRLNFALAMAGNPEILFLDEPTVGMDINSRHLFWDSLRNFATEGRTILLTTHYLEEADSIADRIVVIDRGQIVADGTPDQLKKQMGGKFVSFVAGPNLTPDALKGLVAASSIEWSGRHVRVETNDTDLLIREIMSARLDISNLEVKSGGLEDVFRALTENKGGLVS